VKHIEISYIRSQESVQKSLSSYNGIGERALALSVRNDNRPVSDATNGNNHPMKRYCDVDVTSIVTCDHSATHRKDLHETKIQDAVRTGADFRDECAEHASEHTSLVSSNTDNADTAPERQSGRKAQVSNITAAKVFFLPLQRYHVCVSYFLRLLQM
jgi:hypothetical protein